MQNSQRPPTSINTTASLWSPSALIPVFALEILTARILTGAMVPTVRIESAWLVGQVLTAMLSFLTQRILPASILAAGTVILTLILRLLVLTRTATHLTDVF